MAIKKVKIHNFKQFKDFEIEFNNGVNILVGNNDSGKSTILESIHIALTGLYGARNIRNELSQYLFNNEVVKEYLDSVKTGHPVDLPKMFVEIYFDGSINTEFEGDYNTEKQPKVEGVRFEAYFDEKYADEYSKAVALGDLLTLPIEYYEIRWITFAREQITIKSIPIKSAMIDSSQYKYQNGSDVYISKIVKDMLEPEELVSIAQAHRKMKEGFITDTSISTINKRISEDSKVCEGEVSISVDLGTKNAWENSLVTQLNNVPFSYIGKGSQCVLKTELALTNKKSQNAKVILIEEPESHLSFSKLNHLIKSIQERYEGKQVIISTHSSFVANKLGLGNLLLLENGKVVKFEDIPSESFFKKIAGYDTLRFLLCKKAILVEGDSDELIVQKAYMKINDGRLPIEDEIDVISVGTSFLRFLEIACALNINVAVVTDNDGNVEQLKEKYNDFLGDNKKDNIKICFDPIVDTGTLKIGEKNYNYNTLEPKLLKANDLDISLFNRIFNKEYDNIDELRKYMKSNKTECALAIFESSEDIKFPQYILEAIDEE